MDGLSLQCLASTLFMYFAILAPVVTFGGLLGEATDNHISVIEALIGKKHAFKIYDQFALNTSCFCTYGPSLISSIFRFQKF